MTGILPIKSYGTQSALNNFRMYLFNPTSVMTVVTTRICKGYWAQTEALEQMLAQQPTKVTVTTFGNDSNVINSKDELLTLLIHYGYLGYEKTQGAVKELSSKNSRSSQGVVKEYSWSAKQQAILDYCAEPRTLEEITLYLNVADRYYLKRKYINPMLDRSLFMTEPDTPTSPTQRYYTKK